MGNTHKQGNCACKFLYAIIICLASLITFQAKALSQPGESITLKANDIAIAEVFKSIYKQTKLKVTYSNIDFNDKEKVTVNFSNTPMRDVMTFLLKGKDFNFQFSENLIIISKKEKESSNALPADTLINVIPSVTGKVTDAEGKPIIGATVIIKGTNDGATTNAEGNFTLPKVPTNAKLLISSVGYETREFSVKGHTILAQLNIVVSELDETVVIAYGTTTKRYSTGNVSTVKAKDIEKQPVNNPLLALQGNIPGLFIEQATGLPGTGIRLRIQGQNSISSGNEPLYVIDGVPYTSNLLPGLSEILGRSSGGGNGNPFSFINPADIESIDVLKDADATAIYGSRAANGAILITTKKGKSGQTRVDVNLQHGWGKVAKKLTLLNTQQYLDIRKEAYFINDGLTRNSFEFASAYDINGTWDSTRHTDWQKELIGGTAKYTDIQTSITGGNTTTQYLIGFGYHKETTVFPGGLSDTKGSVHFNINNTSANQKFKIQFSGNYMLDKNQLIGTDLTGTAVIMPPNAPPLYNDDGSLNWAQDSNGISTWVNPLAYLLNEYRINTNNLVANAVVGYSIFPNLEIKSSFGYTDLQSNEVTTTPITKYAPETRAYEQRNSAFGNYTIRSWVVEPQITIKKTFGKGSLDMLVGASLQQSKSNQQSYYAYGFSSDLMLEDILSAPNILPISSIATEYRYNGLFGRASYNYGDKYILNLTARRDGSSRFGSENLFHNFYSIGGAWLISNERVIKEKLPFISFAKLRASYGTIGNDQIGDYRFLALYVSRNRNTPYQGVTGLASTGLSNPYLQWEETRKMQAGIDIGLFKDRILLNANFYRNRSSNQLQDYGLPIITGFGGVTMNFPATVQNTGWEFTMSTINLQSSHIKWQSNINLTIAKNKLVEFEDLEKSSFASVYVIGQPITIQKVFHLADVDPLTGLYRFVDKDGKLTSTPNLSDDKIILVDPTPSFYGGVQNSISYKGVSLDLLFQFVKQKAQNYALGNEPGRYYSDGVFGVLRGNQPAYVLNRWQKPGDRSANQLFSSTYPSTISMPYGIATTSNAALTDASYIRLKNVSISWQLPENWVRKARMQNLNIYVKGQNVVTFTKYKGLDPESKSTSSLPPLMVITLGARATF